MLPQVGQRQLLCFARSLLRQEPRGFERMERVREFPNIWGPYVFYKTLNFRKFGDLMLGSLKQGSCYLGC